MAYYDNSTTYSLNPSLPPLSSNHCENVADTGLSRFAKDFQYPHGVITLIISILGVTFNIVNVIVLLDSKMKSTVNILLTFLAIIEIMLLTIYIPYILMFSLLLPPGAASFTTSSKPAAYYLLFYVDASVFLHLSATWLIITTAFFRFLLVQFPIPAVKWCTHKKSIAAGMLTILGALLCTVPNTLMNVIIDARDIMKPQHECFYNQNAEVEYYAIGYRKYFREAKWSILLNWWLFATIGKFVPCALLAIFTVFLIKVLNEAAKRQKRLHNGTHRQSTAAPSNSRVANGSIKKTRTSTPSRSNDYRQTTRMLLAVVILFFVIELPHGILLLWAGLSKQLSVYNLLGDLIDALTLTAFSINFILYSVMSRQYRALFISLLTKPFNLRLHYEKSGRFSRRLTLASCKTEEHVMMHSEIQPLSNNQPVEIRASISGSSENGASHDNEQPVVNV